MGMAASQARYLALIARQSNCEYEGQQINQSRLLLANQSANLFNQMLGLSVPVPPSTQDFTKTQYSYTDGLNASVIDSWKQLSKADPEFNYVVKTHYYSDVYTGSMKLLSDPQVQISNVGQPLASQTEIETALRALKQAETDMNTKYENWQAVKKTQEAVISQIKQTAQEALKNVNFTSDISASNTPPAGAAYQFEVSSNELYNVYQSGSRTIGGATDSNGESILAELYNLVKLGVVSIESINSKLLEQDPSLPLLSSVEDLKYDSALTAKQAGILETFTLVKKSDGTNESDVYISTLKQAQGVEASLTEHPDVRCAMGGYPVNDGTSSLTESYINQIQNCQDIIDAAEVAYNNQKDVYDAALQAFNGLSQPTYIGNCPVTYLTDLTDDQLTELQQVYKDMVAQDINTDIRNCFDDDGNYLGGVYSFELNGVTYYTTYNNLVDAYASNSRSNNDIDAQYKLPYYNASYISTRIDKEGKALLETDGNGRFSSIRFEDDSVKYTLNVEQVTDDVAYQDAMNKYLYENAMYDKAVQDINAKTSIIQRQDQELELKLKQLDTERQALKQEVDAVKGVIKDNISESFKTFSS